MLLLHIFQHCDIIDKILIIKPTFVFVKQLNEGAFNKCLWKEYARLYRENLSVKGILSLAMVVNV